MDNDAAWYRQMGDFYTGVAAQATTDLAKFFNASEAEKYYSIANGIESRTAQAAA